MRIESLHIRNYKVFKDAMITDIPGMSVFVGANGSGKSTLFDIFGFLRDALVHNVRHALARRGGFKEVVTRGADGPIELELDLVTAKHGQAMRYSLSIDLKDGFPIVRKEALTHRNGESRHILDFKSGKGHAVTHEKANGKGVGEATRDYQELDSADILAIKGLGQFQKFKPVSEFRKFIENWHISDFHISDARAGREAGFVEHLSSRGDNLPLVARYMYEHHRGIFNQVLDKMKRRVPGLSGVEVSETEDGRIILKFQDESFKDPFIAKHVSDGTIKMFAYLLLLHDPGPHPLLCVEEPENQLYPKLLGELAEEFRLYSRNGQVFVSTHSPDLLNAMELGEIFWLEKREGVTTVRRAESVKLLKHLLTEGDLPGTLWKQGFFKGIDP